MIAISINWNKEDHPVFLKQWQGDLDPDIAISIMGYLSNLGRMDEDQLQSLSNQVAVSKEKIQPTRKTCF